MTKILDTSGVNGPATDFSSIFVSMLVDPSGQYFDLTSIIPVVIPPSGSYPITVNTVSGINYIGIPSGSASTDGYISSGDWNTFNNKQTSGTAFLLNQSTPQTVVSGIPIFSVGLATIAITNNGQTDKIDLMSLPLAPVLINAVPLMTSDTTPSGIASASTVVGGAYMAWKAFDHDTTTFNRCWASSAPTGWLQYQFPTAKTILNYKITAEVDPGQEARAPRNWTLQGSNTNSWPGTILDTQTLIGPWISGETKTFSILVPASYLYYRLDITANNGTTIITIEELELMESSSAPVPEISFITNGAERARFEETGNFDLFTPLKSTSTLSGTNIYNSLGEIYKASGTAPITVTNGLIAIPSGSASTDGYIASGDWIKFNASASINEVFSEVPTGDVDGLNNQYTTFGQVLNNDMLLFKNGLVQTPIIDYTISTSTITMTTPPPVNSKLIAHYKWNVVT